MSNSWKEIPTDKRLIDGMTFRFFIGDILFINRNPDGIKLIKKFSTLCLLINISVKLLLTYHKLSIRIVFVNDFCL
jgi:hypothetical protein